MYGGGKDNGRKDFMVVAWGWWLYSVPDMRRGEGAEKISPVSAKSALQGKKCPVSMEKVQILKSERTFFGRLPFLANVCASTATVVDDLFFNPRRSE